MDRCGFVRVHEGVARGIRLPLFLLAVLFGDRILRVQFFRHGKRQGL